MDREKAWIRDFALLIPVNGSETGSYLTAHTTTQSSGIELHERYPHSSREQRAFSSSSLSPRQSLQDKKADLDPPSLHRKIPFPTRMSETGSMTG